MSGPSAGVETTANRVDVTPVDASTWPLFEELFGPDGVEGGCWCSYFKLTAREFSDTGSAGHRRLMKGRVEAGEPFGLVARVDGAPRGWVAVSPRSCNARLERSVVARVPADRDLSGTWSVTCFYVRRGTRSRGLSSRLLAEAVAYARANGAEQVEGYPVDVTRGRVAADDRYHGRLDVFLDAGFDLVERRGKRRALVRLDLGGR